VRIFDDYHWNLYPEAERQPRLAIDAFLACYRGRYRELHRDGQVIVEKTEARGQSTPDFKVERWQ